MPRERVSEFEFGGQWLKREGSLGYYRYWYDPASGRVRRRTLGTPDLAEAKELLVAAVLKARQGPAQSGERLRLAVLFQHALEEHAPTIREADNFGIRVAYLAAFFGGATVAAAGREAQEALIRTLAGMPAERVGETYALHRARVLQLVAERERAKLPHSPSYIAKIMKALSKCLHHAHARQRLTGVPYVITSEREIAGMIAAPAPAARERVATPVELAALFDAVQSESVFRWLIVALNTGARPEAAIELSGTQCDVANRIVDLNPPGKAAAANKRRPVISMTDNLMAWVRIWGDGPFVAAEAEDGTAVQLQSVKKGFNGASKRAGFHGPEVPEPRRITRYTIRHTVATWMRKQRVPKWEVSGWLGHEFGSAITERYAKYDPDYLSDARKAIDALMVEIQKHCRRPLRPGPQAVELPANSHSRRRKITA